MAQFSAMKLTKQGLKMQAMAQLGKTLNFTEVKVGNGFLPDNTDILDLTGLVAPINADVEIVGNSIIGDGTTNLRARIKSGDMSFYLREIGVYAKVENETPHLYSYAYSGDCADFIPKVGGNTNIIQDLNLITVIGNAENVIADINLGAEVTWKEFNDHTSNKTNPHEVTKSQVGLGNVTNDKQATKTEFDAHIRQIPEDGHWGHVHLSDNPSYSVSVNEPIAASAYCAYQIYQLAKAKNQSATIVIGSSAAGYTVDDVNYLCDGTADQTEINAAVASLANGGKIVLLEGTYNISAPIEMNTTGVKLCGMGHATKIKPSVNNISLIKYNSSWSSVSDMWLGCDSKNTTITGIEVIGAWGGKISGCIIRNVNYGIKSTANSTVFDKIFIEQANYGIVIDTESGYTNKIINSYISSASVVGIRIGASSFANTILNNCFMASSTGIEIAGSKNIVSGSSFIWGATTSVNILSGAVNNIVTENILMGSDVINSGGSTNTILNNKLVS